MSDNEKKILKLKKKNNGNNDNGGSAITLLNKIGLNPNEFPLQHKHSMNNIMKQNDENQLHAQPKAKGNQYNPYNIVKQKQARQSGIQR